MTVPYIFVDDTAAEASKFNENFAYVPDKDDVKKHINNFVLPATANTSFTSNANNNPYGFFFDDGKARYGCERIHFMGLVEIKDGDNIPFEDSSGKKGYHPVDQFGNIRYNIGLFGNWTFYASDTNGGGRVENTTTGDYMVYTGICNKFNIMTLFDATNDLTSIYVDGVDTTNNFSGAGSNILASKYYNANQVANIPLTTGGVSAVAQGIHTIKLIKDDTNGFYLYGIEIVNEANSSTHEICVPSSSQIINGKKVAVASFTGASSLPLKGSTNNAGSAIIGTKGGFVGYYVDENGLYISKVQEPIGTIQSGVARYNGALSDTIDGLSDSTKFYANSQGNIIRVKDAGLNSMLLVPTGAPGATSITVANDYDGVSDTTLFAGNKQYQADGVSGSVIAPDAAVTVGLYAKIGANANHTNEELYTIKSWDKAKNKIVDRSRTVHFGDFGNQRSDDFTSLTTSMDAAFLMDDGSSNLVGEDALVSSGGGLWGAGAADFFIHTFFGTGLDIETQNGMIKICSDLPLASHTFMSIINAGGFSDFYIDGVLLKAGTFGYYVYNFYVYRPKKVVLTENYDYLFYNYVVADYVSTNLPTQAISTYNGAIDQGVIRKGCARESVYTGTWTYTAAPNSAFPTGRNINTSTNADQVAIQAFLSGYFRTWMYFSNAGDDEYVNVDGANQQTNNPAGTNFYGWKYTTANPTEALHTINRIAHRTAGTLGFDAIDYHAPVFNQFYNLENPFPDYLMGQTGVLDNRKLVAYDEQPDKRIVKAITNLADGTTSAAVLYPFSLCSDLDNVEVKTSNAWYNNTAGNSQMATYIKKDAVDVKSDYIGLPSGTYTSGTLFNEVKLSKRSRLQVNTTIVSASVTLRNALTEENILTIEEK